ncbi:MAG: DUF120 domain-containing protein [Nanobdellota archaeon]
MEELLLIIAEEKGIYSEYKTSTKSLSEKLSLSQQSVSRKLRELENEGKIKRDVSPGGMNLKLTEKGRAVLRKKFKRLQNVLKTRNMIKGEVTKGLGEGSYYIRMYADRLEEKLGYEPFYGTLNLKVDMEHHKSFISDLEPIIIEGFNTEDRSFGSIKVYRVITEGIESAIVVPQRSLHKEGVIEIIGPSSMRESLKLKESDPVKIEKGEL